MTLQKRTIPKYRHYRPKNLAVVRLNGKDHYLGTHGSPESLEKYDRLIAEWLVDGRQDKAGSSEAEFSSDILVNDLLLRYLKYAKAYYADNGKRRRTEFDNIRYALRPLRELYGGTHANKFGPLALKAIRERMIELNLCRTEINRRINQIRRMFKWAVSEELISVTVYESLKSVAGLRSGKSGAKESKPVGPVDPKQVEAVLKFVSPQVKAMVTLQQLTGMRPGEVVAMRARDIDRSGDIWIYAPAHHKTLHRGHRRRIALGPRAQAVLRGYLMRDKEAFLFSPREAAE